MDESEKKFNAPVKILYPNANPKAKLHFSSLLSATF